MRRIVGIALCGFLVSTALSGQQASAAKKNASSVSGADKKEIEALRLKIALLEGEVAGLEKRIGQIEQTGLQNYIDIAVLKREEATFDPSSPGTYRTVNTDVGPLLVALGKVEQYLDGYKVSLEIGNPLSVTFSGFEVEAAWGPRLNPGDDPVKWATVRQNKRISSTQVLAPGRWCPFDIILPTTESRGFGYVNLKISVNTLSLVKTQ